MRNTHPKAAEQGNSSQRAELESSQDFLLPAPPSPPTSIEPPLQDQPEGFHHYLGPVIAAGPLPTFHRGEGFHCFFCFTTASTH